MCGASSEQKQTFQAQMALMNEMTQAYHAEFGQQQAIFKDLTSAFQPILEAGIGQAGFTPQEEAALRSQATEGTAQGYMAAQNALSQRLAATGGGNAFLPSGAQAEIQSQLATSAAQQESGQQLGITAQNYATGRQNFLTAANALSGVAGMSAPTQAGAATVGAGSAAGQTATEIATANNAWMGALGSAVGGALGGLGGIGPAVGGIRKAISGTPSLTQQGYGAYGPVG